MVIGIFLWALLILIWLERIYLRCEDKKLIGEFLLLAVAMVAVVTNLVRPVAYFEKVDNRIPAFLDALKQADVFMKSHHEDTYMMLRMYASTYSPAVRVGSRSKTAPQLMPDAVDINNPLRAYIYVLPKKK